MPSTPLVVSRSPGCTSALAAMKRSSSAPPCDASPKATLRWPVRAFITGIACSRSMISVTSLDSGCTRVTCPITPRASITGEPRSTPCVAPRSMITLRLYGSAASWVISAGCAGRGTCSRRPISSRSCRFSRASCSVCCARCDCASACASSVRARSCAEVSDSSRAPMASDARAGSSASHCSGCSTVTSAERSGCDNCSRWSAAISSSASAPHTMSLTGPTGPA